MLRLLIMCSILGFFGVFFEAFGAGAEPMDSPNVNMEPMNEENMEMNMALKSKRHYDHSGAPCPLSYEQTPGLSAYSGASVHQKPFVIANYQKPMVAKMIYQTIQRPAIHHATFTQPMVKHQVQYIQQPTYVQTVKNHPIPFVKPATPKISYENLHKLVTSYVRPVHENQQIQMINPYVKEIPCDQPVPVVIQKPISKPAPMMLHAQSYYPKQLFQPISYHQKPMSIPKPISIPSSYQHQTTNVLYHKPSPIAKISIVTPKPEPCDEPDQQKISYVKVPQSIPQAVHVPTFQYAPKYHQPMFEFAAPKIQQQIIHVAPKMHQPIVVQQPMVQYAQKAHSENAVVQYAPQPIVYGPPSNAGHYAAMPTIAPHVDHQEHYQSPIITAKQPCDK